MLLLLLVFHLIDCYVGVCDDGVVGDGGGGVSWC